MIYLRVFDVVLCQCFFFFCPLVTLVMMKNELMASI